jgi:hypothetical protein
MIAWQEFDLLLYSGIFPQEMAEHGWGLQEA